MWGDLTGRLKSTDFNAALKAVGEAVAPPAEDDDESYSDGEYEDDDGEEYEEYSDEEDGEERSGGGFGLVGMLSRTLDRSRQEEEEYEEEEEVFDLQASGSSSELPAPAVSQKQKQERLFEDYDLSAPAPEPAFAPRAEDTVDITKQESTYEPDVAASSGHSVPAPEIDQTKQPLQLPPIDTAEIASDDPGVEEIPLGHEPEPEGKEENKVSDIHDSGSSFAPAAPALESAQEANDNPTQPSSPPTPERAVSTASSPESVMVENEQDNGSGSSDSFERIDAPDMPQDASEVQQEQQPEAVQPENASHLEVDPDPFPGIHHQQEKQASAEYQEDSTPPTLLEFVASESVQEFVAPESVQRQELQPPVEEDPSLPAAGQETQSAADSTEESSQAAGEIDPRSRQLQQPLSQLRSEQTAAEEMESISRAPQPESDGYGGGDDNRMATGENVDLRELQMLRQRNAEEIEEYRRRLQELEQEASLTAEAAQDTIQNLQSRLVATTDQLHDLRRHHAEQLQRYEARLVQFHEQVLPAEIERHQVELAAQVRAKNEVQEQLARTLAMLDDKDTKIQRLTEKLDHMTEAVTEHQDGMNDAEVEMDELHDENEALQKQNEDLEAQNSSLLKQVADLKDQLSSTDGMHMELTMLRESRDRERNNVSTTQAQVRDAEAARDAALSQTEELRRSLAAAQADRDVAKADADRALKANVNLQQALGAFQEERQAELDMIAGQHIEAIQAIEAAHEASQNALKQVHQSELQQIQAAGDAAVQNCMKEIQSLEETNAKQRVESVQFRRSLDEAISRLQSNQEDVVDRTVMKNIVMDWCTVTDKSRRQQILQLLANMLHFSEEEREKVHLSSHAFNLSGRLVTAIAPSLPPPRHSQQEIAGDNVREKWVNFLLSEIDDE